MTGRVVARTVTLLVLASTVAVFPQDRVQASTTVRHGLSTSAGQADLCSVEEWRVAPSRCLDQLGEVAAARLACLSAPTPETPDAGMGGWFAQRPEADRHSGVVGLYTNGGYAGYSYTTYDVGCASTIMHPDYKFENTVANIEFMAAVAIIGAANAVRERAWDPGLMWSWADPLVDAATKSIYDRVFTVFGAVTLAVVGLYLLWRSRQAQMSAAMTTTGWAILVMVVVTAISAWPVQSARIADQALISTLGAVHDAVGPQPQSLPESQCPFENSEACIDHRPPASRASDTAVHTMLYRNWLRGLLGSADSQTAQKYGHVLFDAKVVSWLELSAVRDPATRDLLLERKSREWMRIAEQIKTEDPEAYQYLQGIKGMERVGAGFIALLSAVMYAAFDMVASLLVLLGFLVFRWAVIVAPLIGTVAILRPASGGLRRLLHSVVASLFNIVVFGTGAALYLQAVDVIMATATLPGWLQMVLVLLCGIVGWLVLRPYRRITQLGGKDPLAAIAAGGFLRARAPALAATSAHPAQPPPTPADQPPMRVELRAELPSPPQLGARGTVLSGGLVHESGLAAEPVRVVRDRVAPDEPSSGWADPAEAAPGFALYRPSRDRGGRTVGFVPGWAQPTTMESPVHPGRVEARPEP